MPIQDIKRSDTQENVIHAALENDMKDFVKSIIQREHESFAMSYYEVTLGTLHGKKNCLHIATEKADKEMVLFFLNKIRRKTQKQHLIQQETVLDIQGQRPRLFSCLHLAAFYGHTELVRLYLDEGVTINHTNSKKDTALLWAARWGHNDTVKLLLDKGADPDVANDKGSTALYWAIRYQYPETVQLLLMKNANPATQRKVGLITPIILAAAYGNTEIVKMLLQHSAVDVNVKIRGGDTPMHHAAREGHIDVMRLLIASGAQFDNKDEAGDTPLLLAAKNDFVAVVDELINKGADINARNHDGYDLWYYAIENEGSALLSLLMAQKRLSKDFLNRNPLLLAASNGRCDKIKIILEMNIDPNVKDLEGNTFLHHAAMNNKHEVIEAFHSVLPLNIQNKAGDTALHIACQHNYEATITTLLNHKAKSNVCNRKDETPLHKAAMANITPETAKQLISYTIKSHDWNSLNSKDMFGNNCLHVACRHASASVIWEFKDVKISEKDHNGLTPLHVAVREGRPDILNMVLDIFEKGKRDVSINEQSFNERETVLHLAAEVGHTNSVDRLISLGADIACMDINGDTVLHRIIKQAVNNDDNHVNKCQTVFETILDGLVKWWCIKSAINCPDKSDVSYTNLKRQAFGYVVYHVYNNDGLSVLDQAFQSAVPSLVRRLLLMENVTMFEQETVDGAFHVFDVTGLTPATNEKVDFKPQHSDVNVSQVQVLPLTDKKPLQTDMGDSKNEGHLNLSSLEILMKNDNKSKTSGIMDIPPLLEIERHYRRIVSVSFTFLMIIHIAYMTLFTYIGIDLSRQLRQDSSQLNESDTEYVMMYVIVPLEPALVIIYTTYRLITKFRRGDFVRDMHLDDSRGVNKVFSVLKHAAFPVVSITYAALVFAWVGAFTQQYDRHDYLLATSLCIGWLLTITFTRGIEAIHYFYEMLVQMIVRDITRFLVVYIFILLAFGFAFHACFQVSEGVADMYKSPADTLFLTFNMMIGMGELFDGDFETEVIAAGRTLVYTKILYLIYIILSTVVMLNLLIAMMNDSYSSIFTENQMIWRIESINLGLDIESSFPFVRRMTKIDLAPGNSSFV